MSEAREGILVIDKQQGPTSHDVVAQLRKVLGLRRIGHCGTLDPLATGVLVICFGSYTRLSEAISHADKEYVAELLLGATSDTGDAQGVITPAGYNAVPEAERIERALSCFRGNIEQVPPVYSALKIDGVRSYVLARQNRAVAMKPRRVDVGQLEVLEYFYPKLLVRVVCSKGTYIRSLAADIGGEIGCGAYVNSLRRTRVGGLDLTLATGVEQVASWVARGELSAHLVPPSRALDQLLPSVTLAGDQIKAFLHGGMVETTPPNSIDEASAAGVENADERSDECAVYDGASRLCGLGAWVDRSSLRPLKVLVPVDEAA